MGLFNRKKKNAFDTLANVPHEHVWKDFPWYMVTDYSGVNQTAEYSVIEPYVCLTCGERKNVILDHTAWSHIKSDDREEEFAAVRKELGDKLKPRAVVEDMINDTVLVKNPNYVAMLEKIHGLPHPNVGTSMKNITQVVQPEKKVPRIEL